MNVRDYFYYDLTLNKVAYLPVASTLIGATRLLVNLAAVVYHASLIVFNQNKRENILNTVQMLGDLQGMKKGVIELIPVLGGIGSWYLNTYKLTPAQILAYKIQTIYQAQIKSDDLISQYEHLQDVIPEAQPLPGKEEFYEFINKEKVKISTNMAEIDDFVEAFDNARVDRPIFKDKNLPFYALAAFYAGRIDRDDMATIMEFYTANQCFKNCTLYKIVDENNQLQTVAEEAISKEDYLEEKSLTNVSLDPHSTREFNSAFLNKIKVLPPKKQLMWTHDALLTKRELDAISEEHRLELLHAPIGSLAASLVLISGTRESNDQQQVGFSFAAERHLLNLSYNKTNNPMIPRLGAFEPSMIQNTILDGSARLCATFFPGTKPLKYLHNSLEAPTTVTMHDKIHSHILQRCPKKHFEIFQEWIREFVSITDKSISKETWELAELVVPTFWSQYDQPDLGLRPQINNAEERVGGGGSMRRSKSYPSSLSELEYEYEYEREKMSESRGGMYGSMAYSGPMRHTHTDAFNFCGDEAGRFDELSFKQLMHDESGAPTPFLWTLLIVLKRNDQLGLLGGNLQRELRVFNQVEGNIDALQSRPSKKQQIWLLQQSFAGKSIENVPANARIKFVKLPKAAGLRKNTVVLRVSP